MKTDAQHKLFNEIIKPKVLIIRDVIKGVVGEVTNEYTGKPEIIKEEEDYIQYGEFTVKGFPLANTYFPFLSKLGMDFLQEIEDNSYYHSLDYISYLSDLRAKLEKLLQDAFEDFHGLTRYKHFTKIVHVDFMNVDYHWQLDEIPPDHPLNIKIHEFSVGLEELLNDIFNQLTALFNDNKVESTDTRINCKASREEIQNYFYQLDRLNNNGVQILTREDIDHFLQTSFQSFDNVSDKRILNPVGLTRADIRYFIRNFIINFDPNGDRQIYARICRDSFLQFENSIISRFLKMSSFLWMESLKTGRYPRRKRKRLNNT